MNRLLQRYIPELREMYLYGTLKCVLEDLLKHGRLPHTCLLLRWLNVDRDNEYETKFIMSLIIQRFSRKIQENLYGKEKEILLPILKGIIMDMNYHIQNNEHFELISDMYTCETILGDAPWLNERESRELRMYVIAYNPNMIVGEAIAVIQEWRFQHKVNQHAQ